MTFRELKGLRVSTMLLLVLTGCAGQTPVERRVSLQVLSTGETAPHSLLSAFMGEMDCIADAYIRDHISDQRIGAAVTKGGVAQAHRVSPKAITISGTPLAQYERDRACYETEQGWRVRIAFVNSMRSDRLEKHPFMARSGGFPDYFVLTIDPVSNAVCNVYAADM